MNKYRFLPTSIWSDDVFLNMSPEQKLIYLYLITSPYTSLCGIFKLSISTMGHFVGLRNGTIESAFKGFLLAYSDWVKYDEATGEVAILYWPKFALVNANVKAMKKAQTDLEEVRSFYLLQEVIKRNSATLSKMYLTRLRQLQAEKLNRDRALSIEKDGNVLQVPVNEGFSVQREIEREIERENILSDFDKIEPTANPDQLNATGTGNPVKSSAAAAPNSAPAEDEFPFQAFWDAYDHKVGRAKSEKKWKRMTKKEKREAMRVVAWYVKDTVKDDSEQYGNVWRPRRQNPLTWLNGPGWEDYAGATGPRIKNQPAPTFPGSRFQAPRPTIPAGYARNEPLDIKALPD